jgi:hypothetical protein
MRRARSGVSVWTLTPRLLWVERWLVDWPSSLPASAVAGASGSILLSRASSSSVGRSAIATLTVRRWPSRISSSGMRVPIGCWETR